MSRAIRQHLRSNVVGYIALFCFAMGGTAYATHPGGANTISTGDIQDGQVQNADLGPSAVTTDRVANSTLTGSDVATSGLLGSDIATDTLGSTDIGVNAVGTSELAQVPGARARSTAAQTIANNGAAIANLDTEDFDTGGLYTAPNDSITISVPGTYMLSGEVGFAADPQGHRSAQIQVDGTAVAVNQTGATSPAITRVPVSTIVRLLAGDVVTLRATHSAGNSLATASYFGVGHAYLAAQWLSD